MHKTDLVKHLAKKNRRSQKHYQTALNEILAGIQEQLSQGKEVVLTGFGTFYTRHRKGGKGFFFIITTGLILTLSVPACLDSDLLLRLYSHR